MTKDELCKKKIGLISLGCDKNRVDSERVLFELKNYGFEITSNPNEANILIVNTCAFIEPARKESIETILEMAEYKNDKCEKLIVIGCLPQKFMAEVKDALPEVDCFLGTKSELSIINAIADLYGFKCLNKVTEEGFNRLLTTPKHYAFLKIAEGCSNNCAYCNIPLIRGQYVSEPMEKLIAQAKYLVENGVKELIVVAQDVTKYGIDLYGRFALVELLQKISQIDGLKWIRLHYCYPELVSDELINEIANNPKICKYIEIPFQHADDSILKQMKRASNNKLMANLVTKLRSKIPNIAIRTSFILGFPTENEDNYNNLKQFIIDYKLEHIGFFTYSREKDTLAYDMKPQVPKKVAKYRANELAKIQEEIVENKNLNFIGKQLEVVIEDVLDKNTYIGRSQYNSPNVDTIVYINSTKQLQIGDFCNIIVTNVVDKFDLQGDII
ncbi:MAG: 30S ribosomal protein S12 methylthiotransferase RimO [Clostridia bacterium]|nr:30S ribosomal protein S12 methylthiotransferase RimO [Clostridia bacterium]